MAQDERLQIRAIRENAHSISGSPRDHDSLLDLIGDCHFVLIGEASHGTHDFYQAPIGAPQPLLSRAPGGSIRRCNSPGPNSRR
jgi:hypothetical protein